MLCSQSGSRLATQPRASQADHLGEHLFWLGHVDQQRPCVDKVKRVTRQPGAAGAADHDLDAVEATFGNEFGRHFNVSRVAVQPNHPPPGRHPSVEQLDGAARTAAEIDRAVTGRQFDSVQQGLVVRRQLVGLAPQTLALAAAGTEAVDGVGIDPDVARCHPTPGHRITGSSGLLTHLGLHNHTVP